MKKLFVTTLAFSGLFVGSMGIGQAAIIQDTYEGPTVAGLTDWDSYDGTSSGANNGSNNQYDLFGYTYSIDSTNTLLTLVIYSGNIKREASGFTFYESYFDTGILTYGLGDLFLSKTAPTFAGSPADWNYVVDLGGDQKTRVFTKAQGTISPGVFRGEAISFAPPTPLSPSNTGWTIDKNQPYSEGGISYDTLTITFNYAGLDWDETSTLYAQFAATCGNDILRMEITGTPVPEPTTLLLFGAGLASLAAVGRRRRQ